MLIPHICHGIRDLLVEAVISELVRACTRELEDLEVVVVDRVECLLNSAYGRSHRAERYFKAESVGYTFLEEELKVGNTVAQGSALPIVRVVELQSRCLVKGNAVVISVLALSNCCITVEAKYSRGSHTVENILLVACNYIVVTALAYGEVILDPLTYVLPLLTADSVKQGSVGSAGRVSRAGSIRNRIYRLVGGSIEIFCLYLYDISALTVTGVLLTVVLVGAVALARSKTKLGDNDRLVNAFKRQSYLALFIGGDNELEGSLYEAVGILKYVGVPSGALNKALTDLVLIGVSRKVTNRVVVYELCRCLSPLLREADSNTGIAVLILHFLCLGKACCLSLSNKICNSHSLLYLDGSVGIRS